MTESNPESNTEPKTPPLERLVTAIESLSDEHRSLLVLDQLAKVDSLVNHLRAHVTDPRTEALVAAIQQTVGFTGLTVSTGHGLNEEWTSTGDKKVERVWDLWTSIMEDMVVSADSLPEDLRERIKSGQATEEDLAEVMRIVAEKTGLDTSDMDLDVLGTHADQHRQDATEGDGAFDEPAKVKGTADYGSNLYL